MRLRVHMRTVSRLILILVFLSTLFPGWSTLSSLPIHAGTEQATPELFSSLSGNVTVHFIDVGQGDAIYVDTPGLDMLVDGGSRGEGDTVVAYLRSINVTRIDFVVATHPHADHIGGLIAVLTEYNETQIPAVIDSGLTYTSETYEDYVTAVGARNISVAMRGEDIDLGHGVEALILNPVPHEHEDTNDNSIVLWLQVYNVTFLLAGDSEVPSEESILMTGYGRNSTILKVGHHGSRTSTSLEYLDAVDPKVAVISVGEDNRYDHPHNETLDKLLAQGSLVYRTDYQSTIWITTDGDDYTIFTEESGGPLPPTSEPEPEPELEPETGSGIPGFTTLQVLLGGLVAYLVLNLTLKRNA
jgi:beta-lactamase superfamily II metal-dependent hydrolase